MKLTDTERLILANQYEILGTLKKDDSLLKLSQSLKLGHSWLYSQSYAMYVNSDFSKENSDLVLDILGLYEAIQVSYENLPENEKSKISETSIIFPGFDGNNESEFRLFADALYEDDRYTSVKSRSNSHMPSIGMYQTMIEKWEKMNKKFDLTVEDIQALLQY
jgi:uncharacterized protein YfbU (UPF0304 family)